MRFITRKKPPGRLFDKKLIAGSKSTGGFTLVELMVVIAIIGLLSSVVISSLNVARMKARDARRLSDARQIEIAWTLAKSTNNGDPVLSLTPWTYTYVMPGNDPAHHLTPIEVHMKNIPNDPLFNDFTNGHWYYFAYMKQSDIEAYPWLGIDPVLCANKEVFVIMNFEESKPRRQDCPSSNPNMEVIVIP